MKGSLKHASRHYASEEICFAFRTIHENRRPGHGDRREEKRFIRRAEYTVLRENGQGSDQMALKRKLIENKQALDRRANHCR